MAVVKIFMTLYLTNLNAITRRNGRVRYVLNIKRANTSSTNFSVKLEAYLQKLQEIVRFLLRYSPLLSITLRYGVFKEDPTGKSIFYPIR